MPIALVFLSQSVPVFAQVRIGIIIGVVVDEKNQRPFVQAFSAGPTVAQVHQGHGVQTEAAAILAIEVEGVSGVPFWTRASRSASADSEGRFQV